jgi:signal transduction histidine kinase/ActR/RegA family two-component response regulator
MKVQTKILLLLLLIVATLVGGLVAVRLYEDAKFRKIAEDRAVERDEEFDKFLSERGDKLEAFVDDSTIWDDMVLAILKKDAAWFDENVNLDSLIGVNANAVWVYSHEGELIHSVNNRYTESLRELPLPPHAVKELLAKNGTFRFFAKVEQGWIEIRGASVHPSRDSGRQTKPPGSFFAAHIWIDENVKQMARFTGYDVKILSAGESVNSPRSAEERGLIRFARVVEGWDGKPVAQIRVEHDSPIIKKLNEASDRLFIGLMIFAGGMFLLLATCLILWVRRPLRKISRSLANQEPAALAVLQRRHDEFGKLACLIAQHRSTEEKLHQAEEELRHSQKLEAVGRLAGGVAHDFNNLLTAIIGYSELLEARLASDGVARDHARMIHKAGEQAAGLTKQLLAFSRKQLLQPKVLDLNRVVQEMEKLLQRVIGEHIRIVISTEATDARVLADPNQLEQVILNLGVNARDAMPGGGTLTITTRNVTFLDSDVSHRGDGMAPGQYVTLAVSDTGSGMDGETKTRIFEPFFTTKGPGKGTGLGLATVYGIVKQSHGGITVESELGKGSTFQIELPLEDSPLEAPRVIPVAAEGSHASETILVVEDEEVVRLLVCEVLGDSGYKVLCAAAPSEALRIVREHGAPIDLLVTDVVMPEMHGPALARVLQPMQPQMKVLYVSGYSENDISDQGVVDPDLDVLQKPFTHHSLTRKIREVLDEIEPAPAELESAEA